MFRDHFNWLSLWHLMPWINCMLSILIKNHTRQIVFIFCVVDNFLMIFPMFAYSYSYLGFQSTLPFTFFTSKYFELSCSIYYISNGNSTLSCPYICILDTSLQWDHIRVKASHFTGHWVIRLKKGLITQVLQCFCDWMRCFCFELSEVLGI